MKRIPLTLALAISVSLLYGPVDAQNITDIGATPPTPGTDDAYMLDNIATYPNEEPVNAAGNTLNYYSNGGGGNYFPGQIFTTGANPTGYSLTSVTILPWSGDGGGITTTLQEYTLRVYSYNSLSNSVALIATYTSSNSLEVVDEDYVQFTDLGAALLPNTEYAYSFENDGDGWIMMGAEDIGTPVPSGFASSLYNSAGTLIDSNDMAALIPSPGGVVGTNNMAPGYVAAFDVGLSPITSLTVNPPSLVSPGNVYPIPENAVSNGTEVAFSSGAVFGASPYFYQWQTDGGGGGALTNIPGATASNLMYIPFINGFYNFDVVVSNNNSQSVTSKVVSLTVSYPTESASFADEGLTNSASPYYLAISQTNAGGTGDNLNYYDNDLTAPPGNIFTTGDNAQGYILNSVQVDTGGSGTTFNETTTPQSYFLYIYSVNADQTKGLLVQAYTNASSLFTFGDWLEWSGLNVTLAPNSTYAYAFANDNIGWAGMNMSTSGGYPSGQIGLACLISPQNGSISLDSDGNAGTFQLGLTAIGAAPIPQPLASPISVSPLGTQLTGTEITLSENALGAAPLTFIWQTDNGAGGDLASVANNDSSNLIVNTTGWQPGAYRYDVIVSNSYGMSTSGVVSLTLIYANSTGTLTDLGSNAPTPGPYDIAQLISVPGSEPSGLNYYFDNGTPPGQTFTTGPNALGYNLTNVDIKLAGGSGGPLPPGGQGYFFRIYTVNTNTTNAVLYAIYESQTNFILTTGVNDSDWIGFGGFSVPLLPNSTYAYTFGRDHSQSYDNGWDEEASDNTNAYAGGQAVLIGPAGGAIYEDTAGGVYDATFDLALSAGTPTLSISQPAEGQVTVQWSSGVLLQASSLAGPWTTNFTATSPYTVTPKTSGPQMFYKVEAP